MILCVNNNGGVSPTDHTIVKAKNISSLLLLTKQKEKMRTCCLPSFTSSSSSSPLVSSSPASRRVRLRKVHLFAANENEEQERELDEKTREALRLPSKSSQDDDPAAFKREMNASETWKAGNTAWETEWIKRWMRRRTSYSLK